MLRRGFKGGHPTPQPHLSRRGASGLGYAAIVLLTGSLGLLTGSAKATPIDAKYVALGGPAGFLGRPTDFERPTPDNVGRYRGFEHGSIHWSPSTGAHETHGLIRDKWAELGWERGFLGYPTTDESMTPDHIGRYNHFQGGSIYWTPNTGAHEVHGYIRGRWEQLGWEQSKLGYPTSDERDLPGGGRVSYFQHGRIEWTAQGGAHEILKSAITGATIGAVIKGSGTHTAAPPKASGPTTTGGSGVGGILGTVVGGKTNLVGDQTAQLPKTSTAVPTSGAPMAGAILGKVSGVRLQEFARRAPQGSPVLFVRPASKTATPVVVPAVGSLQLRPGEFYVTRAKPETIRVGGNTLIPLPIQALTQNAAGELFDLHPALELGSAGLEIGAEGNRYSGKILVGVLDRERPNVKRPLPEDMWVLLRSTDVDFDNPQVTLTHTNPPFESALVSGNPHGNEVQIEMQMGIGTMTKVLPVHRPGILISGAHTVEGLGAGPLTLVISLAPGAGGGLRSVALKAERGSVVRQLVKVSELESQEVQYRSLSLGPDSITATAAGMAPCTYPIRAVFPWGTILASILGGGLGAVILRLLRPRRDVTALTRYFFGGVLMGFLVACAFALGLNLTSVPIPIQSTPLSTFFISAVGAIAAIPLVAKWSEGFRGFLKQSASPDAQTS